MEQLEFKANLHKQLTKMGFHHLYSDFEDYNDFINRLNDAISNNPNVPIQLWVSSEQLRLMGNVNRPSFSRFTDWEI